MELWQQHLKTAAGYLGLGLIDDAANEIEEILPQDKLRVEVVALRIELYRMAERWDGMEALAKYQHQAQPGEAKWLLDWAWATRRSRGLAEARAILEGAEAGHQSCALLHYNLACYLCVMGEIPGARDRLGRALALDKDLRLVALEDPDLAPLFGQANSPGQSP
jgi:tetratricopeptide (TPR) repeat protein